MRFSEVFGLLAIIAPWAAQAAPAVQARATVPSADPFYQPPAGFENTAPGTILRSRKVATAYLQLIPDFANSYQLLYRTTAANGSAIATVTTIFEPFNAKTDRFVSFQTAYDSSATICDPSYNYQFGALPTDLISQAEQLILAIYLAQGYIVASSDYEGPEAAFSAGRLAGTGVLDNIRAVQNFNATLGLTSDAMVVGVGYSGGAIATGWAASLQPTYAPELNIKGWVAGGTPANLTSTLEFLDNTLFSGFLVGAVAGLLKPSAYGATLGPLVDEIITPSGRSVLDFAAENCAVSDILRFPYQSILSYDIQSEGPHLVYNPIVAGILSQQTMGISKNITPTAPVLLYHATNDEIIPYNDVVSLDQRWCADGASVHFTTYANGGHITTEVIGVPAAIEFVASAFAGTVPSGCSANTELSNILNPIALGVSLEPLLIKLLGVLVMAGEGDSNLKNNLTFLQQTV